MGNEPVVTFSTTISAPTGSSERASETRDSTICSARHMSVSGLNCKEISVAPRMVLERTPVSPSTEPSDCSSGRVKPVETTSGGAPPLLATTTMRGNSTSG